MYNNILISLGGRAAEKFVLNDSNMLSIGSYSDLVLATETANKMIKAYGHGDSGFVIKHNEMSKISSFNSENLVYDSENQALDLLKTAEKEVDDVIVNNKDLLIEMIEHLSNNSQLNGTELTTMCKKYSLEIKNKDTYYNIKERINNFRKENILNYDEQNENR